MFVVMVKSNSRGQATRSLPRHHHTVTYSLALEMPRTGRMQLSRTKEASHTRHCLQRDTLMLAQIAQNKPEPLTTSTSIDS